MKNKFQAGDLVEIDFSATNSSIAKLLYDGKVGLIIEIIDLHWPEYKYRGYSRLQQHYKIKWSGTGQRTAIIWEKILKKVVDKSV